MTTTVGTVKYKLQTSARLTPVPNRIIKVIGDGRGGRNLRAMDSVVNTGNLTQIVGSPHPHMTEKTNGINNINLTLQNNGTFMIKFAITSFYRTRPALKSDITMEVTPRVVLSLVINPFSTVFNMTTNANLFKTSLTLPPIELGSPLNGTFKVTFVKTEETRNVTKVLIPKQDTKITNKVK